MNPGSSQGQASSGSKRDEPTPQAGKNDPWANNRGQVGGDLRKAGEQVAQAGAEMGQNSSQSSGGQNEEDDPLVLRDDQAAQSGSGEAGGEISAEIQAAREALERAGVALQTAGDAIMTAETEADIAAAEEALAEARVAVIVAEEELAGAREAGGEQGVEQAEEALGNANRVIVVATRGVIAARGEFPGGTESSSPLDDELDESLAIFEGKIQEARKTVLDSAPPPAVVTSPGDEQLPGGSSRTVMEEGAETDEEPGADQPQQTGRMPGPAEVASATGAVTPPEDIPDAQGDDIVAQQLREAAMAETDPELREKLWEEYRRYKEGISK